MALNPVKAGDGIERDVRVKEVESQRERALEYLKREKGKVDLVSEMERR